MDMLSDPKYSRVSTRIGAAPDRANLHWSRPSRALTFASTSAARLWPAGVQPSPPSWAALARSSDRRFDQSATDLAGPVTSAAMARTWSAILSQTMGTPKKSVGLATPKRSLIAFSLRSYGRAKKVAAQAGPRAVVLAGATMSRTNPATCERGKYESSRSSDGEAPKPADLLRTVCKQRASKQTLSCEIMTAFGSPVVPDV
mmetsp:Transcript_52879/g.160704  ORF Transcript_52879/g.160704 Transcript_52879/m.160704 type:complete len:201 (-) Transcript_52879:247-849(-)